MSPPSALLNSLKELNGTTHRFSVPSHLVQCLLVTLRMLVVQPSCFLKSKPAQQIFMSMERFDHLLGAGLEPVPLDFLEDVAVGAADQDGAIDHSAKLYNRALQSKTSCKNKSGRRARVLSG